MFFGVFPASPAGGFDVLRIGTSPKELARPGAGGAFDTSAHHDDIVMHDHTLAVIRGFFDAA